MPRGKVKRPHIPTKAQKTDWETPDHIFKPLDREFHFTLDAAANHKNAKCKEYFTKEMDGLIQDWAGHTVWLNPEYDAKSLKAFTRKVLLEAANGVTTVMLVPAKTDQSWWHAIWQNYFRRYLRIEYRWIKGRVKFVGAQHSGPIPVLIIVVHGKVSYE